VVLLNDGLGGLERKRLGLRLGLRRDLHADAVEQRLQGVDGQEQRLGLGPRQAQVDHLGLGRALLLRLGHIGRMVGHRAVRGGDDVGWMLVHLGSSGGA
jgi:hypothetical protein